MLQMLSVLMRGCITLFSIHGDHYIKVNMRYACMHHIIFKDICTGNTHVSNFLFEKSHVIELN